ncbi:MAG: tetratricopeptide repeat protein [Butyricicoccaceae bacterium]
MMTCANELWSLLSREDFGGFAENIHYGLANAYLQLSEIYALIMKLHEQQLYYAFDDDAEEWQYISYVEIIPCATYFVFLELYAHLRAGNISMEGSRLIRNSESLDLCELQKDLENQAREYDEDPAFGGWLQALLAGTFVANEMQIALLKQFNKGHAALIFVMVHYLRKLNSVEELQSAQRIYIEKHTKDELIEIHAKLIHTSFCYYFLEQRSDVEMCEFDAAQKKMRHAAKADEFVIALANADIWIRLWLDGRPMLPYTAYMILTDGEYHADFFDETSVDFESWCEEDTGNPEIAELLAKAKIGEASAQDILGTLYLVGEKVEKNERKACYWIKKAAEQGVATSQVNYGVAVQQGLGGIESDYAEAIAWFLKAAKQNEDTAQYNLGLAYSTGKGVPRDPEEANKWFKLAAENGNIMAKMILANGLIIKSACIF